MAEENRLTYYLDLSIDDSQLSDSTKLGNIEKKAVEAGEVYKEAFASVVSGMAASPVTGFMEPFLERELYNLKLATERAQKNTARLTNTQSTDSQLTIDSLKDDVRSSMSLIRQTFRDMFGSNGIKNLVSGFSDAVRDETGSAQIAAIFNAFAPKLQDEVSRIVARHNGTVYDSSKLGDIVRETTAFKNMVGELRPVIKDDARMNNLTRQYSTLLARTSAASYAQTDSAGRAAPETLHRYGSFKAMLPKSSQYAFENYGAARLTSDYYDKLDAKEIDSIQRQTLRNRIKEDAYLLQALEKVGVVKTSGGKSRLASHIQERDLRAAEGILLDEIVSSAKGMGMYGIKSWEDLMSDEFNERVIRKGNRELVGTRDAASFLGDRLLQRRMLGDQNPLHQALLFDTDTLNYIKNRTRSFDKVTAFDTPFADRRRRLEVPVYTPAEASNKDISWQIQQGGKFNLDNQFKNGQAYHHEMIDDSEYISALMKYATSDDGKHTTPLNLKNNDFMKGIAILRFPENYLNMTKDEQDSARKDMIDKMKNGWKVMEDGKERELSYVSGNNGNFLFARKEWVENVKKNLGKNYFWGGADPYGRDFSQTSAIIEHAGKGLTGSYNIMGPMGIDPNSIDAKDILIVDSSKAGVNGTSWMSSKLAPLSFQARAFNIKNTMGVANFGGWADLYGVSNGKGIPMPLVGGGVGYINDDTKFVISADDIKDSLVKYFDKDESTGSLKIKNGTTYEAVRKDVRDHLVDYIGAVRSVKDAAKNIDFISGQAAGMMSLTPEDQGMFLKEYQTRLRALDTPAGAIKYVFGSDSDEAEALRQAENPLSLMKEAAYRQRINDTRESILRHMGKGDLPVPAGLQAISRMGLPSPINFINDMIKALPESTQIKIPKIAEELYLNDNEVMAHNMAGSLGINRLPSALGSWQKVANILNSDKFSAEEKENVLNQLEKIGFDKNAVYLKPGSTLLTALQGADTDGDVFSLYSLAATDIINNKQKKLSELSGDTRKAQEQEIQAEIQNVERFKNIIDRTKSAQDGLMKQALRHELTKGKMTEDQMKTLIDQQIIEDKGNGKYGVRDNANVSDLRSFLETYYKGTHAKQYDNISEDLKNNISDEQKLYEAVVEKQRIKTEGSLAMGGAAFVGVNAFNLDQMDDRTAAALVQALVHYDVNSTTHKKLETFQLTDEERSVLGKHSIPQLIHDLGNVLDENGNIDIERARDKFGGGRLLRYRPVSEGAAGAYKVGQTGAALMYQALGDFRGVENMIDDVARITGILPDEKENSAYAQYVRGVLDLVKSQASGRSVHAGREHVNELMRLRTAAATEIKGGYSEKQKEDLLDAEVGYMVKNLYAQQQSMSEEESQRLAAEEEKFYQSRHGIREGFYSQFDKAAVDIGGDKTESSINRIIAERNRFNQRIQEIAAMSPEDIIKRLEGVQAQNGEQTHRTGWSFSTITGLVNGYNDPLSWFGQTFLGDPRQDNADIRGGYAMEAAATQFFNRRQQLLDKGKTEEEANQGAKESALARLRGEYRMRFGRPLDATGNVHTYQENENFINNVLPGMLPGLVPIGAQVETQLNLGGNIKPENTVGYIDQMFFDPKTKSLYYIDYKNTKQKPEGAHQALYGLQLSSYGSGKFKVDQRMADMLTHYGIALPEGFKAGGFYSPEELGLTIGNMATMHTALGTNENPLVYYNTDNGVFNAVSMQTQNAMLSRAAQRVRSELYEKNQTITPTVLESLAANVKRDLGLVSNEEADEILRHVTAKYDSEHSQQSVSDALMAVKTLENSEALIGRINKYAGAQFKHDTLFNQDEYFRREIENQKSALEYDRAQNGDVRTNQALQQLYTAEQALDKAAGNSVVNNFNEFTKSLSQMSQGTHGIKGLDAIGEQFTSIDKMVQKTTQDIKNLENTINRMETRKQEAGENKKNAFWGAADDATLRENKRILDERKNDASFIQAEAQKAEQTLFQQYVDTANGEFDKVINGAFGMPQERVSIDERVNQYKANLLSVVNSVQEQVKKTPELAPLAAQLKAQYDQATTDSALSGLRNAFAQEDAYKDKISYANMLKALGYTSDDIIKDVQREGLINNLHSAQSSIMRDLFKKELGENFNSAAMATQMQSIFAQSSNKGVSVYNIAQELGLDVNSLSASEKKILREKDNDYKERQQQAQKYIDQIQDRNNQAQYSQMLRQMRQQTIQQRAPRGALAGSFYRMYQMQDWASMQQENYQRAIANAQDQQKAILIAQGATDRSGLGEDAAKQYDQLTAKINEYKGALDAASAAQSQFSGLKGVTMTAVGGIAQSFSNLLSRFSYRAFMTAINNIKNFVKQYDASMLEIQMITLKSDSEMETVSESNIDLARELKTNALQVSQIKSGLYRQGLSDVDVEARTEAILKLSRVSGINTNTASKIITTALQNGLVEDAEQAIDVLAALGDSAATTADEVQKALQKTAASAANAGVSYEQLTAILTAAISKTQLSGNVVGTAFSTIMTRMRKINETGYVKAANGEKTSVNDVTKALSRVGVKVFEGDQMRNVIDILMDLASVWGSIESDVLKQNIVYSMAGRGANATNTFYTVMDSMSEDGEYARLLGIATDAAGTVDKKYESYMDSLTGNMEGLKGAFQELIDSIVNSGFVSNILQYNTELLQAAAQVPAWVNIVTVAVTALAAAFAKAAVSFNLSKSSNAFVAGSSGILGGLTGLLVAGAGLAVIEGMGSYKENKAEQLQISRNLEEFQLRKQQTDVTQRKESVQKAQEIFNDFITKDLLNSESIVEGTDSFTKYNEAIDALNKACGSDFVDSLKDGTTGVIDFGKAIESIKDKVKDLTLEELMKEARTSLASSRGIETTTAAGGSGLLEFLITDYKLSSGQQVIFDFINNEMKSASGGISVGNLMRTKEIGFGGQSVYNYDVMHNGQKIQPYESKAGDENAWADIIGLSMINEIASIPSADDYDDMMLSMLSDFLPDNAELKSQNNDMFAEAITGYRLRELMKSNNSWQAAMIASKFDPQKLIDAFPEFWSNYDKNKIFTTGLENQSFLMGDYLDYARNNQALFSTEDEHTTPVTENGYSFKVDGIELFKVTDFDKNETINVSDIKNKIVSEYWGNLQEIDTAKDASKQLMASALTTAGDNIMQEYSNAAIELYGELATSYAKAVATPNSESAFNWLRGQVGYAILSKGSSSGVFDSLNIPGLTEAWDDYYGYEINKTNIKRWANNYPINTSKYEWDIANQEGLILDLRNQITSRENLASLRDQTETEFTRVAAELSEAQGLYDESYSKLVELTANRNAAQEAYDAQVLTVARKLFNTEQYNVKAADTRFKQGKFNFVDYENYLNDNYKAVPWYKYRDEAFAQLEAGSNAAKIKATEDEINTLKQQIEVFDGDDLYFDAVSEAGTHYLQTDNEEEYRKALKDAEEDLKRRYNINRFLDKNQLENLLESAQERLNDLLSGEDNFEAQKEELEAFFVRAGKGDITQEEAENFMFQMFTPEQLLAFKSYNSEHGAIRSYSPYSEFKNQYVAKAISLTAPTGMAAEGSSVYNSEVELIRLKDVLENAQRDLNTEEENSSSLSAQVEKLSTQKEALQRDLVTIDETLAAGMTTEELEAAITAASNRITELEDEKTQFIKDSRSALYNTIVDAHEEVKESRKQDVMKYMPMVAQYMVDNGEWEDFQTAYDYAYQQLSDNPDKMLDVFDAMINNEQATIDNLEELKGDASLKIATLNQLLETKQISAQEYYDMANNVLSDIIISDYQNNTSMLEQAKQLTNMDELPEDLKARIKDAGANTLEDYIEHLQHRQGLIEKIYNPNGANEFSDDGWVNKNMSLLSMLYDENGMRAFVYAERENQSQKKQAAAKVYLAAMMADSMDDFILAISADEFGYNQDIMSQMSDYISAKDRRDLVGIRSTLFNEVAGTSMKNFASGMIDAEKYSKNLLRDLYALSKESATSADITEDIRSAYETLFGVDASDITIGDVLASSDELAQYANDYYNSNIVSKYADFIYDLAIGSGAYTGEMDWDEFLESTEEGAIIAKSIKEAKQKGVELTYSNGSILGWSNGVLAGSYDNKLREKVYTPSLVRDMADKYVQAGVQSEEALNKYIKGLTPGEQDTLKSTFPELIQYYNLSEYDRNNTQFGQNLKREIDIKFATFGVDELEQAGEILEGMTQNVRNIMSADFTKSFKGMYQTAQTFSESGRALELYDRAVAGEKLTQEQWNAIGSAFGISDIGMYQSGALSLSALADVANAQRAMNQKSALATYNAILKAEQANTSTGLGKPDELGNAQILTAQDNSRSEAYKQMMERYGYVYKHGTFVYDETADQSWRLSSAEILADRYAMRQNTADMYDQTATMFALYNMATDSDFIKRLGDEGNASLKAMWDSMVKNGNFDKYIGEGGTVTDIDAVRRLLFAQAFGFDSNAYTYSQNDEVANLVDGLLNGTLSESALKSYMEKEDWGQISSAASTVIGSQYNELLRLAANGETASAAQLNRARQETEGNLIADLMKYSNYSAAISQMYDTYANGTGAQRNQMMRGYQREALAYGNALWALEEYGNGGQYNDTVMQMIMNATGLSETEVRNTMVKTGGKEKLQSIMRESIAETEKGIMEYFAGFLGVDVNTVTSFDGEKLRAQLQEKMTDASEEVQGFINMLLSILDMINMPAAEDQYQSFETYVGKAYDNRYNGIKILRDIISANGQYDASTIEGADREGFVANYGPLAWAMANDGTSDQILGFAQEYLTGGHSFRNDIGLFNSMAQSLGYENFDVTNMSMENGDYSWLYELLTAMKTGEGTAPFYEYLSQNMSGLSDLFASFTDETKDTSTAVENFLDSLKEDEAMERFGKNAGVVIDYLKSLKSTSTSSAKAMGDLYSSANKIGYQYKTIFGAKGKKGSQLGTEELDVLGQFVDKDLLKTMDEKGVSDLIDNLSNDLQNTMNQEIMPRVDTNFQNFLDSLGDQREHFNMRFDAIVDADGNIDLSALMALVEQFGGDAHAIFGSIDGITETLQVETTSGEDWISYAIKLIGGQLGKGTGGVKTGGGGGGGGKSKLQKYLEKWAKKFAVYDHEIKMIQYQETKYQNAGELSNYGAMIELENEAQLRYISNLEKAISGIKGKMKTLEKESDDWYAAREAVMKYEEQIEAANQAIRDNTKKLEENQQAIYKTRTDLEDLVRSEADTREKTRRDILSATVSMEETILEAIRKRYQDEWDLIKRDIDRKRNALEEEKNLINERLQARKDAEQEAEKYEQLAEYQRQLAYVSMDPTRTKDALELQHKIDELQKELAWTTAEREAQAQQEAIDDQIEAYDQFVQIGDEDLAAYLEDANNFTAQVKALLEGSQEELMSWLKANVDEYKLALDEQQQNMVESWTDTWKTMMHITETWAELIVEILTGRDSFINYMKQSDEYLLATDEMKPQLLYKWNEMWDDYINSRITGATYSHTDDWMGYGTSGSSNSGNGGSGTTTPTVTPQQATSSAGNIVSQAIANAANMLSHGYSYVVGGQKYGQVGYATKGDAQNASLMAISAITNPAERSKALATLNVYKEGGLADYTGLAWVDGTKTRPEAFLSADDTKLMRGFLNAAKYVSVCATMTSMPEEMFNGNGGQNIESVNITINEATINDDMDIQELAEKIGDSFIKELSINGMNASKYSY